MGFMWEWRKGDCLKSGSEAEASAHRAMPHSAAAPAKKAGQFFLFQVFKSGFFPIFATPFGATGLGRLAYEALTECAVFKIFLLSSVG